MLLRLLYFVVVLLIFAFLVANLVVPFFNSKRKFFWMLSRNREEVEKRLEEIREDIEVLEIESKLAEAERKKKRKEREVYPLGRPEE